ncbi:MAG TPA: fused MFS/spermidine synthase [bacterium]
MSTNRKIIFLSLFFISGACGLIYEIVWSRLLVLVFGGTTFAITTILACFMGGLALGSFLAGRFSPSINNPLRIYGILEIFIGIFCLFVPFLFDLAVPMYRMLVKVVGGSLGVLTIARVLVSVIILIIPTTCMGATLPILAKSFVRREGEIGSNVAYLYGFNTIGSFLGSAGAGFLLLPTLGLKGSIWLAVIFNILVGTCAILLSGISKKTLRHESVRQKMPKKNISIKTTSQLDKKILLALYGLSGLSAMAFQVAWTRALILSLGSSTYAFSAIVACFIFGLAIGSFIISFWADKIKNPLGIAGLLELVIGLSALLIVLLFGEMPEIVRRISEAKDSFEYILLLEILYVFGLLILPTLCMGALMPLICRIYDPQSSSAARSVGNVYASNTVGTIIGAILAGFILIPSKLVGMQNTIILASVICGLVGTVFILNKTRRSKLAIYIIVGAVWILGMVIGNQVKPWSKNVMVSGPYLASERENYNVLYYREGIDATVAVTSPYGSKGMLRALRINGKPDASNEWGDMITQSLLANIPLLLKPDAKEICNIGLGAGITAGSALAYPVEKIDVVEISAAVVEAAKYFEESNNKVLTDQRVKIHLADARNFLLLTDNQYDLIISEPSNPWMSGIANLYTKEFFKIVNNRLKPGGMHCQWIHSYSMKADDFAAIIRTISEVFPYVQLWELMSTDFLILGSNEQINIDIESFYRSFAKLPVAEILSSININDPMQMANFYVAEGYQMLSWIKNQKILADDLPYLEFSAPRYLLKNEHFKIIEVISNFDGIPVMTGYPNSNLNKEFSQSVEKAGKRRKYLYQANVSALQRDLNSLMGNFIQAALNGSSDARAIQALAQELLAYHSVVKSIKDREIVDKTSSIISTIIPDFVEFKKAVLGEPAKFYWPFTRDSRTELSPELQKLMSEANHLSTIGAKQQAFKKAEEAFKIAPQDPSISKLMGILSLDLASEEKAIPYLLKALIWFPNDNELNYNLARAYAARGDRDSGVHFLETAIENGFNDFRRIESDSLFNSLRDDERFQKLFDKMKNDDRIN